MEGWILGIGAPVVVGALGWLFKLESRISVQKAEHDGLKELFVTRFDSLDKRLEEREENSNFRLQRIERTLNGKLQAHD